VSYDEEDRYLRRRIHVCHMRRRPCRGLHVCHMRRRPCRGLHVCHMRRRPCRGLHASTPRPAISLNLTTVTHTHRSGRHDSLCSEIDMHPPPHTTHMYPPLHMTHRSGRHDSLCSEIDMASLMFCAVEFPVNTEVPKP
jgi:hypothetical protein